jgi:mannosyltransferase OCH1-like enzyme
MSAGVVQSLWVSGELPLLQEVSIASFLAKGHEYHLYTYNPAIHAPTGTVIRDAQEIIPIHEVFRDQHGYAAFSDCFRYRLLLLRGGWWVDTDLICLKPFYSDKKHVFGSEHLPGPHGGAVPNNGIIKAPVGSPPIAYADQVCAAKDRSTIAWAELGPALLATTIRNYTLEAMVVPPEAFCPVPWFQFSDVLDPDLHLEFGEETYAVHLWNAIWGRQGLDTNAAFHPNCPYERWKRQFLSRRR